MRYQVFSDNEWIYPDTELVEGRGLVAHLYAARGGDVCFQILTDLEMEGTEKISFAVAADEPFAQSITAKMSSFVCGILVFI